MRLILVCSGLFYLFFNIFCVFSNFKRFVSLQKMSRYLMKMHKVILIC